MEIFRKREAYRAKVLLILKFIINRYKFRFICVVEMVGKSRYL
jgi:hypothetical protein